MDSLERDFWKTFSSKVWSGYKITGENHSTIFLEIQTIDGYRLPIEYNKFNGRFTYMGKRIP